MKQLKQRIETELSQLRDALNWWDKLGIKKAECLGNKYYHRDYGIVAIDDTTYEEITHIYQQETKQQTVSSNSVVAMGGEWVIYEDYHNDKEPCFSIRGADLSFIIVKTFANKEEPPASKKALANVRLICEAVNNYQSLKDRIKELESKNENETLRRLSAEVALEIVIEQRNELKDSNRELIEALRLLIQDVEHYSKVNVLPSSTAINSAKSTLQKAKQL